MLINGRNIEPMKSHSEEMYWMTNKKWYRVNEEKDCFELTKYAPPRAIDSFRLWLKQNNLPVKV